MAADPSLTIVRESLPRRERGIDWPGQHRSSIVRGRIWIRRARPRTIAARCPADPSGRLILSANLDCAAVTIAGSPLPSALSTDPSNRARHAEPKIPYSNRFGYSNSSTVRGLELPPHYTRNPTTHPPQLLRTPSLPPSSSPPSSSLSPPLSLSPPPPPHLPPSPSSPFPHPFSLFLHCLSSSPLPSPPPLTPLSLSPSPRHSSREHQLGRQCPPRRVGQTKCCTLQRSLQSRRAGPMSSARQPLGIRRSRHSSRARRCPSARPWPPSPAGKTPHLRHASQPRSNAPDLHR